MDLIFGTLIGYGFMSNYQLPQKGGNPFFCKSLSSCINLRNQIEQELINLEDQTKARKELLTAKLQHVQNLIKEKEKKRKERIFPQSDSEFYMEFRKHFSLNRTMATWEDIIQETNQWNLSKCTFTIEEMWLYFVIRFPLPEVENGSIFFELDDEVVKEKQQKQKKKTINLARIMSTLQKKSGDSTTIPARITNSFLKTSPDYDWAIPGQIIIICRHRTTYQMGYVFELYYCTFGKAYELVSKDKSFPKIGKLIIGELFDRPEIGQIRAIWPSLTLTDEEIDEKITDMLIGCTHTPTDGNEYAEPEWSDDANVIIDNFVLDLNILGGFVQLLDEEHQELIAKFNPMKPPIQSG